MSKILDLRAWVLSNWPIKLTALVLATVLWAVVAARERTTELVRVTLTVQTPEGRMLTTELPEVQARYSGTLGELAKLLQTPPTIHKVMPDTLTGSKYLLNLSTDDLQTTEDADVAPEGVSPDTMTLTLDDIMERPIPVNTSRIRVTLDTDFGYVDTVAVTPPTVAATGTDAQLRNIRSIPTAQLDTIIRGRVSITVPLDTSNLGVGIMVNPTQVQVTANAVEFQRQYLPGVPVAVSGEWESEPSVVSVIVSGPRQRIRSFTRDSVTVTVQQDESLDQTRVPLVVRAPRGVRVVSTSPDSVLIKRRNRG